MKRVTKWLSLAIACISAIVVTLFIVTKGDYPVPRLVTENASLP